MPKVSFTANLQRHLSVADVEVEGSTVREALDRVFEKNPKLRSYLLDDGGRLRQHVNIFVDNQLLTDRECLSDSIGSDSELWIIQALSGG